MLGYTLRRLAWAIVIMFVASLGVFFLVAHSGDPLAQLRANPRTPPQVIANRENLLHLNDPFFTRYFIWLKGALHGDFGTRVDGNPVGPQMWSHLWITLRMVIPATIISVFVAVGLGVWAAMRQGRMADNLITLSNFLLISVPVFVLGLLLKDFVAIPFNKHVGHTVFYTVGQQSATLSGGFFSRLPDYAAHTALPVIVLVLVSYPSWAIYQRSSMLEVLNSDYVRLARAKGVHPRRVLIRHTLRNALLPVTTVIALDFAAILGGALITEIVFDWDGLGQWGFAGVVGLDFNTVQAYLLLTAFFVVAFNFFADLLYGVLDPRIRLA
jgi:peptide/nickel transport system permease protein